MRVRCVLTFLDTLRPDRHPGDPVALQFTIWAVPVLSATAIAVGTARYVWTQRRDPGGGALVGLAICAAAWSLLKGLSLLTASLTAKIVLAKVMYIPISLAPLCWLAFALGYSGRGAMLRRWEMLVIYAIPLTTIVLAWTNESTGMLWTRLDLAVVDGAMMLDVTHGTWFRVHSGYGYALTFVATVMLGLHIAQSPRHWWRLVPVFGAPMAVLGMNAMHLAGITPSNAPDPTSAGLAVATAVLAGGLMRRGGSDYAPVARSTVVEEMQDCVVVVDRQGRCVDVNRVATELLGIAPDGEMPVDLGVVWAGMRHTGEVRSHHPEPLKLVTKSDGERYFDLTITRLGPQGGRDRSVLVLRDVTETVEMRRALELSEGRLREANERLKHLANTDELTGLPNRRSFLKALERELARADRYDQPLSVVLLDLDHFKRVNDSWGHPVGDRVLVAAAEAVRGVCRDSDVPGRIGGEELAVLLLQTDTLEAELVAERIRRRVAEVEHLVPGDLLRVTASFGVATSGPGRLDSDTLIGAADEALYAAKNGGRNRVVAAPRPKEQTAIDFGN